MSESHLSLVSTETNPEPVEPHSSFLLLDAVGNGQLIADFDREIENVKNQLMVTKAECSGEITLKLKLHYKPEGLFESIVVQGEIKGSVKSSKVRSSTGLVKPGNVIKFEKHTV